MCTNLSKTDIRANQQPGEFIIELIEVIDLRVTTKYLEHTLVGTSIAEKIYLFKGLLVFLVPKKEVY